MASVQYVHTQRFQAEVVAFIQHFTQLQDVLGRQRAAMKGQAVSISQCYKKCPNFFFDILFIAKCTLNRIHVSHKAIIVLYVFL